MPLPAFPPTRTARLCLRAVQADDLAELWQVNGDDEVTRFLPYTSWRAPEDATTWLARMEALRSAGTGQQLVMERTGDGKVIGTLLLFRFEDSSARVEIGYVVVRAHWRCGYGIEAVRGALGTAFGSLGIRRVEAEVHPDNTGSHALLRAVGFVHEGCLRKRWVAKGQAYDTHFYGCLAEEWDRRHCVA
jgi:RimJ/RimL family protein N-acetyltransferase